MSNYTPLNMSLILREGGAVDHRFIKPKRGSFDQVFFPFSIMVLIMSLSFYAVKLMVDITTVPTQATQEVVPPQKIMTQIVTKPTATVTPTPVPEKMYVELGSIQIAPDQIISTAREFYPNTSEADLISEAKYNILEWATLLKYYQEDKTLTDKLTIKDESPVATFGAVLKDLDILRRKFDNSDPDSSPELETLIDEFKNNTSIRLAP